MHKPSINIKHSFNIPTGEWIGNSEMLNGGLRRGELTMICASGHHRRPMFNIGHSMRLRDHALSLKPSTPERYDAVAAYYAYGGVFTVKQEAPGARPAIGWMDWEGNCPDFGEDIVFMLDGTRPPVNLDAAFQNQVEKFFSAFKDAKEAGTLIVIDSLPQ